MRGPTNIWDAEGDHGGVVETSDCKGKGITPIGTRVTCPQQGRGNTTRLLVYANVIRQALALNLSNQDELDRAVQLATPFVARSNIEPSII